MTSKPETTLRRKIIKALREEGGWWTHAHGNPFTASGLPDIFGCYEGQFFGFEVKMPDNPKGLTDKQRYTLEQISAAGGIAAEIRSVTDALEYIEGWRASRTGNP